MDEYDPEVADIFRLNTGIKPDEVLNVCAGWFGEDGKLERRQAETIVSGVLAARHVN